MAQVSLASAALYFRTRHAMAVIGCIDNAALADRLVKAWPSATAFKFCIAHEQSIAAGRTIKRSLVLHVLKRAASRPLGTLLTCDIVNIRGQDLLPFVLADIQLLCICIGINRIILAGIHIVFFSGLRISAKLQREGQWQ